MYFYDTHCHLDFPEFASEVDAIVERAQAAGITKLISIGTSLASSARAIAIAERFPNVYAVVGWHPGDAHHAPDDIRAELRSMAMHPKVVALGEAGLDYYRLPGKTDPSKAHEDTVIKAKQAEIFRQHLEVAVEVGLNLVIHTRESMDDTIAQISSYAGKVRGVFHCFVDGPATMQRVLDMNSIVSFTGILTFKNAEVVRTTLSAVPMGKFMLETDAPFLAPVPYRGKRCEPAYVRDTALKAAEIKGVSIEDLSAATCRTAHEFFPKLVRD